MGDETPRDILTRRRPLSRRYPVSVRPLSSVLAERASADFDGATPAEKERAMMRSVEVGSRPVRS